MHRNSNAHRWNVPLGFRADNIMKKQLEDIADREGVSISVLIRELVDQGIKNRNAAKRKAKLFPDD